MKFHKKTIIAIFCLLFFSLHLQSQKSVIDSLENTLELHVEKDTVRVNILNELAYSYLKKDSIKTLTYLGGSKALAHKLNFTKGEAKSMYIKGLAETARSNFDLGFQYFNEALRLYKTINYKIGIAKSHNAIGLLFYDQGDQRLAIEYFKKSIVINKEIGNNRDISVSSNNIGKAYANLGNYTEALKYHEKALKISNEIGDEKSTANFLNNLGTIYSDQGNYPLALEYYNQSLTIDEKFGDTLEIAKSLNNLGIIYKNLQNYDKAIASYERALEFQKNNGNKKNTAEILNNLGLAHKHIKNYKVAHDYLKGALKTSEEIKNRMYIATCLNNIGDVHLLLNDYSAAHRYFEKAKTINLQIENQRGLCNSYLGIAKGYANRKMYDAALINAIKSKEISDELELMNYQNEVQELLATIYENKGDYKKAFISHKKFKKLNDSLFNKENIEKIAQLENEYKYKRALDSASIRELKLKKTVTATNRDLERSRRNYLWAIIGVLSVSMLLGSIIFHQKFNNIKTKNENIVMEQKLLRSQMTPHFIFNSLSVLQGMILNKEDKKSVSYLSKFSKLLRITLENSRDKSVPLSEEMTAVENYLALQNLENDAYDYSVIVEDTVDTTSLNIPPMLIQPFVENAIAHAFPDQRENRKIGLHLKCFEKKLICTITDNGIGIDAQKADDRKDKKSLATTITSERLELLAKDFKMQGSLVVEDRKKYNEQGTVVTLVIPYKTLP